MSKERNVQDMPYAPYLESAIHEVMENKPVSIAVCTINQDRTDMAAYYNCGSNEKMMMGIQMLADAFLEVALENADMIVAAAQEDEEDG